MRRLHWIVLFVLLFVAISFALLNAYSLSRINTLQTSIIALQNTKPVQPIPVDYSKIEKIVAAEIAALPKAQNGLNGINGTNGKNGTNGNNGQNGTPGTAGANITPDEIATAVVTYLAQNPPAAGPQGNPGTPGDQIQLRCHDNLLEWQYVGDIAWQPLLQLGATESCL